MPRHSTGNATASLASSQFSVLMPTMNGTMKPSSAPAVTQMRVSAMSMRSSCGFMIRSRDRFRRASAIEAFLRDLPSIDAWAPTVLEGPIDEDPVAVVPVNRAQAESHPIRLLQASAGNRERHPILVVVNVAGEV